MLHFHFPSELNEYKTKSIYTQFITWLANKTSMYTYITLLSRPTRFNPAETVEGMNLEHNKSHEASLSGRKMV
jgi:hypothetical protein